MTVPVRSIFGFFGQLVFIYFSGRDGETFDDVPPERRTIGLWSAVFLIFNRIIGTGYATTLAPLVIVTVDSSQ